MAVVIRFDIQNKVGLFENMKKIEKQSRFAAMQVLNETAFEMRKALQNNMRSVFDNPTPYITNSVFVNRASKGNLNASVYLRYPGGKGIDPEKVLNAEVFGGQRRAKRAEVAFQRVGLLPTGWGMVPAQKAPRDAYGNVPGSFIVQLISYFQAFGEQGYRANMTQKRKDKLANVGRTEKGYKRINGIEYFVSRGFGRSANLAPGIWARTGIHGANIWPVFLFVRMPRYNVRFKFFDIAGAVAAEQFAPRFERRFAEAMASAK